MFRKQEPGVSATGLQKGITPQIIELLKSILQSQETDAQVLLR
ncbi:MAG: hypothetical protein ABSC17_06200 [Thermacetogeniaceae bacterium]